MDLAHLAEIVGGMLGSGLGAYLVGRRARPAPLEVAASAAPSALATGPHLALRDLTRPLVLLVDDDHATRKLWRAALPAHGIDVHAVETAAEALALIRLHRYDARFWDLTLRGSFVDGERVNGEDAIRHARRLAPIDVLVTAVADDDRIALALAEGLAVGVLPKPCAGLGAEVARMVAARR